MYITDVYLMSIFG